jgi:hypothetical protein
MVGTTTRSTKAGRKQKTSGNASRTAARPASASARKRALLRNASARAASASAGGAPQRSAASRAAAAARSSSRFVRSPIARIAAAGVRPRSSSAAARRSSERRAPGLRSATRTNDRYGLRPASRHALRRSMTAGAAAACSARSLEAARREIACLATTDAPIATASAKPWAVPTVSETAAAAAPALMSSTRSRLR